MPHKLASLEVLTGRLRCKQWRYLFRIGRFVDFRDPPVAQNVRKKPLNGRKNPQTSAKKKAYHLGLISDSEPIR